MSKTNQYQKIDTFAKCMAIRMEQNEHRGGWDKLDFYVFTTKMLKKLLKMQEAIQDHNWDELAKLATDQANWAWMLVDNLGVLDRFEQHLIEERLAQEPESEA